MINANNKNYSISKLHYKVGTPKDGICYCHVFPRTLLEDGTFDKNCTLTSIGFNVPEEMTTRKHLYGGLMCSNKEFFNAEPDEVIEYSTEEIAYFKILKINTINNAYDILINEANPDRIPEFIELIPNPEFPSDLILPLRALKTTKRMDIEDAETFEQLNSIIV